MEINLLAVVFSAIATMIIGFAWYSPMLFGKIWTRDMRISSQLLRSARGRGLSAAYLLSFFTSLVMAYTLSALFKLVGILTLSQALQVTLLLWLGLVVTVKTTEALYSGKPVRLYFIDIIYELTSLTVTTLIIFFV
jgi:hypothetical protein